MSDVLDGIGDDLDDEGVSRRRSVWGLLVLACVAVIVACLMILLGGSKDSGNNAQPPAPVDTGNPVTVIPRSTPVSSPNGSSDDSSRSSTGVSTPPANVHSGNPCPDEKSCAVDGDAGLITLINKYRQDEGKKPVDGTVSENAKKCALGRGGDGSACVPHYAWTNVPKQDAAAALAKLKGFSSSWMLDSGIKKLEVGWAWNGSGWNVALLKSP